MCRAGAESAAPAAFTRSSARRKEKEHPFSGCSVLESGGDLSSQAVSSQVLSALKGLTSVFGMGTGGSPSPLPPEIVSYLGLRFAYAFKILPKVSMSSSSLELSAQPGPPLSLLRNRFCFRPFIPALRFRFALQSSCIRCLPRAALSPGFAVYSRPLAHPDNRTGYFFKSSPVSFVSCFEIKPSTY